jgi:hypothetical protein
MRTFWRVLIVIWGWKLQDKEGKEWKVDGPCKHKQNNEAIVRTALTDILPKSWLYSRRTT